MIAAPSAIKSPNNGLAALLEVSIDAPPTITSAMPLNDSKMPSQANHVSLSSLNNAPSSAMKTGGVARIKAAFVGKVFAIAVMKKNLIQRIADQSQPDDLPAIAAGHRALGWCQAAQPRQQNDRRHAEAQRRKRDRLQRSADDILDDDEVDGPDANGKQEQKVGDAEQRGAFFH
jgi:hypothetical protein